ncbi:MAG: alkaline phosphatase family protein [Deltaproteobacteria bacterium]|nr:alkaline phosphatase family protein [Deltaproteobacteria bacterium]
MPRRVLLIGLDGATFDLLDPWVAGGRLPALGQILGSGARGRLASTVPPTTPPAWATCMTGLGPGQHGIFDFRRSLLEDPERGLVHSGHIRPEKVWQRLNRGGKTCSVVNVPLTYPAAPLDGQMVTGMLTPEGAPDFTWPSELADELRRWVPDYRINMDIPRYDTAFEEDAIAFLRGLRAMCRARGELVLRLMRERACDFTFAVFVLPDRIQHLFWKYLDPADAGWRASPEGGRIAAAALGAYQELDRVLGMLAGELEPDDLLLLISDHGFGPTRAYFNANRFLVELGLLALQPLAAARKQLFFQAADLGERDWLRRALPRRLQREIRTRLRKRRSSTADEFAGAVDMARSQALFVSVATQGFYVIGAGLAARERVRDRIAVELEALRGPDGERLVDWVRPREEVYTGPRTALAPDLLFQARGYAVLGRHHLGPRRLFDTAERSPVGFHRPDGVLVASGDGVEPGRELERASLLDVAPTVCAALGVPADGAFEGRDLAPEWG